ncbi:MAG TPA: DUF4197 domain-containing protein [Candidatus Binataceae bacterium]|nr:DUF4197 domain-containing protein [Candidatus Binataceae bacterium]
MAVTTLRALSHTWRRAAGIVCVLLTIAPAAFALDNLQATDGLKEALTNATSGAAGLLGQPGGYFENAAVKILLPKSLQPVATGMRALGLGPQIDKFVLSMNQAAEAAAPKAVPIFQDAITKMSFGDAQRIVSGGGTSATDYFKSKTSGELTDAFTPIVKHEMQKYSVSRQYEALMGKSQSASPLGGLLGGGASQKLDIDHYVVSKALDGLFYEVGQEEKKIRTNPAAQVTPLLRQVFGSK